MLGLGLGLKLAWEMGSPNPDGAFPRVVHIRVYTSIDNKAWRTKPQIAIRMVLFRSPIARGQEHMRINGRLSFTSKVFL